jgi:hypothetical protein
MAPPRSCRLIARIANACLMCRRLTIGGRMLWTSPHLMYPTPESGMGRVFLFPFKSV